MQFRWVLDQGGTYRISFVSDENERNSDPMPFEIKVIPDLARGCAHPARQGRDVADQSEVDMRGAVNDDFGLAGITLRLQTAKERSVQSRIQRVASKASPTVATRETSSISSRFRQIN